MSIKSDVLQTFLVSSSKLSEINEKSRIFQKFIWWCEGP